MLQIRQNTFETNSSSMHSLVVVKEPSERRPDNYWAVNDKGELYTYDDLYYGRTPFRVLVSEGDKVWYAYANFYETRDINNYFNELEEVVKEIVPQCTAGFRPHSEHDYYVGTDDYLLPKWLERLNISVKEFITNPKYIVICDGDEYCIWEDMKDANLVNKENIEGELGYHVD